jgi:hypothetical protein
MHDACGLHLPHRRIPFASGHPMLIESRMDMATSLWMTFGRPSEVRGERCACGGFVAVARRPSGNSNFR